MDLQKQRELERKLRFLEDNVNEDDLIKITNEIISNLSDMPLFTYHDGDKTIEYYVKDNRIHRKIDGKKRSETAKTFIRWYLGHFTICEYVRELKGMIDGGETPYFDNIRKPERPNPFLRLVTQYKTAQIKRDGDSEENNNT